MKLKERIENKEENVDTLSLLKEYNLIAENMSDEKLQEWILKSLDEYHFLTDKNFSYNKIVNKNNDWIRAPFAINILCKIDSNGQWFTIPIGLSFFTGFINYWLVLYSIFFPILLYLQLPSVDILYIAVGHSDFVCDNGLLPDFYIDPIYPSFYSLMGFIGMSIHFPFFPSPLCINYGYSLATIAFGYITVDWPLSPYK